MISFDSDMFSMKNIVGGETPSSSGIAQKADNAGGDDSEVWFNINSINKIERDAMPQFFCGNKSKTPENYLALRNNLIYNFGSDPKYATKTPKHVVCEPVDAVKLIDFLREWNLVLRHDAIPRSYAVGDTQSTSNNESNFSRRFKKIKGN